MQACTALDGVLFLTFRWSIYSIQNFLISHNHTLYVVNLTFSFCVRSQNAIIQLIDSVAKSECWLNSSFKTNLTKLLNINADKVCGTRHGRFLWAGKIQSMSHRVLCSSTWPAENKQNTKWYTYHLSLQIHAMIHVGRKLNDLCLCLCLLLPPTLKYIEHHTMQCKSF